MKMRIVALIMGFRKVEMGGCEIYRITMPYSEIAKHGHVTGWAFLGDLVAESDRRGRWIWNKLIDSYDVFIFPRVFLTGEQGREGFEFLFNGIRSAGKKIVYEVDDDYSNEYRKVLDGDAIGLAAMCDAVTVSTPALAERMTKLTGLPSYVLPNCLHADVWDTPYHRTVLTDKITIGLSGSPTHYRDWEVLKDVLPRILSENPNVQLVLTGFVPDYLDNLPQTEYVPHLPYDQYAQIIKNCDMILAPLNDDKFNLCKSPIKVLEGMAARRESPTGGKIGAACIASQHPVYQLAIQDGYNGLLVEHTPDAWYNALTKLIHDEPLRRKLQRSAYKWVWKNHDIASRWQDWAQAYRQILDLQPSLQPL